jgi:hypothetical protein
MRVGGPDPKLTVLPEEVRRHAHVFPNREVAWPNDHAEAAIEAVAAAGKIVVGLDARTLYENGTMMEVPISAWHDREGESRTAAVERARREALDALPLARNEGTHVLIDWM